MNDGAKQAAEIERVSTSKSKVRCALLSARIATELPSAPAAGFEDPTATIVATAELQHQFGGRMVEQGETGLVCRFPSVDNAVQAGMSLLARGSAFAVLAGGEAELCVGVIYGEFADSDGRVDATEVARALELARMGAPGEVWMTEPARSALSEGLQELTVRRSEGSVEGDAQQALWVIEMAHGKAALAAEPEELLHMDPLRLNVRFQGEEWEVTAAWPVLLLGRSPNADITVDDNVVSRSHARIEYRLGRFLLIDHSRNGTFVRRPDGKEVYLQQQELSLSGHGTIGLGLPASSSADRVIEFSVTRRSAAQG